jgi:hypothetical protein
MRRGVFGLLLLSLLAGCPKEERVCRQRSFPPLTISEVSLGRREGSITWLQTGATTSLTLDSAPLGNEPYISCDQATSVQVRYFAQSGDRLVNVLLDVQEPLLTGGAFEHRTLSLPIDAGALLTSGVAPELAGDSSGMLRAWLTLARPDDFEDGTVVVETGDDYAVVGAIEFPVE